MLLWLPKVILRPGDMLEMRKLTNVVVEELQDCITFGITETDNAAGEDPSEE